MNNDLWIRAEQLANRQYTTEVLTETLSDGQIVYLARNPELPNCIAQENSVEKAISELDDARVDFIYFLLVDQFPVPDPIVVSTGTGSPYSIDDSVDRVDVRPNTSEERELLFTTSFIT